MSVLDVCQGGLVLRVSPLIRGDWRLPSYPFLPPLLLASLTLLTLAILDPNVDHVAPIIRATGRAGVVRQPGLMALRARHQRR